MAAPSPRTKARQKWRASSSFLSSKLVIDGNNKGGGDDEEGAEFEFSDVFGPVSSSPPDPNWRVTEIAKGSVPARILTRSHSLVGPSPRPTIIIRRTSSNNNNDCKETNMSVSPPRISLSSEDDEDVASIRIGVGETEPETVPRPESLDANIPAAEGGCELPPPAMARMKRMCPQDFKLLRVVGEGAFGKVFQVQEMETEEIYAMKVMRKDRIMEKNHAEYMKAEREILTKILHPFIVQLRYSFQTKSKLYLILDFINGGHLFFQLYRQGTFSEDLARIYTAEIVSAVAHLHNNGIIHRDLKPENILLDAQGHVKLTDFGLAKEIDDSKPTNSMCGTMEYMAPEIVLAKGHGKAADWWSVGILLFEMLTGKPPFTHNNRQKLQQKIVKDKIKLPSYLTSEAHSFLKGLLQKDPEKRLGNGSNGSDDIKQHKWFKSINWKKLEAREILPKFIPEVNGQDCIANFDERWTKMPAQDSPASTPRAHQLELFDGYTYVAPNTWLTMIEKANV